MSKIKIIFITTLLLLFISSGGWSIGKAESFFNGFELGLEQEIGYYNYKSLIRQKRPANLPPGETERINNIFARLVGKSPRNQEINFKLTIVNDPSINAFALPGGYIFLNSGLISFARTDGEIAGVLGHEIGHVDHRHAMKALYRTVGISAVWGLIIHKNDSKHRDMLNRLAGLSMTLIQLGYSREAEFEADAYGVKLMTAAGYNKTELLNFWNRVATESDGKELPKVFQLFSTHPPINDRIRHIESL